MPILTDDQISQVQRIRDVSHAFTYTRAEFYPVSTMIRKGPKPKSSLYEMPFKQRFTPTDSAIADNQDVTAADFINNESNKAMLQGRVQKGRVAIGVGDIAQEVGEEYAASDLLADNMSDGMIQARENTELTILKDGDSCAANDPVFGPAMHLRGIANWIRSANPGGSPDLPIPTIALCPATSIVSVATSLSGNINNVTDTVFNQIMQSIATAAFMKGVWDVFVTPAMMAVIDGYTNVAQVSNTTVPLRRFNKDMGDTTISMEVRFYQTSFGRIRFHLHYSLPDGVYALIVQMEHWALRPGYPIRTRELPYLGGSYRRIIEYINGLDTTNPRSNGKITT